MLLGILIYHMLPYRFNNLQIAILMLLFATGCFMPALIFYLLRNKKAIDDKFLLTVMAIQLIAWIALIVIYFVSIGQIPLSSASKLKMI